MSSLFKHLLAGLFVVSSVTFLSVTGCNDDDSAIEETGEEIEEAADEVEDELD